MSTFQLPAIVCFVTGGCFNMTSSKIISEMSDFDKFPVLSLLCMVPNVNSERNKSRTRTSFPRWVTRTSAIPGCEACHSLLRSTYQEGARGSWCRSMSREWHNRPKRMASWSKRSECDVINWFWLCFRVKNQVQIMACTCPMSLLTRML